MSDEASTAHQDIATDSTQTVSPPTLTPVSLDQRINALDILRGFALMGILLMNIEWFGRPIGEISTFNLELTGLDHAAGWLIRCFVEGKFYKLFALLFGMGFAVMLTQAMRKDRPFGAWFTRRMLVLFVFGLAHMFFLWQGDILHDYALAGLLLLGLIYLLRKKRFEKYNNPNSILKLALWWLCVPMLMATLAGVGFGAFVDRQSLTEQWQKSQVVRGLVSQLETDAAENKASPEGPQDELLADSADVLLEAGEADEAEEAETTPDLAQDNTDAAEQQDEPKAEEEQTPQEQAQEIFEYEQELAQNSANEIAALKDGTYWQATVFRTKASIEWLAFSPFFALTMLMPIFLLGYWLVISGAIKNHVQHPKLFGYMARIGLGVGLFITVGGLSIMGHPAVKQVMPLQGVGNVLFMGGQFFMAAGYLGMVIRLLDSPKWYNWLVKLAPMGRMALTNYIMHSVIATSIFYGYAGGLYGDISRAPQMLIVLAILAIQIPLSSWWLTHFQFGPLEWLWRSLTYKKWQAFRVAPH
ncbi:DUF418 domain-containing protein [uncultured Paraglaciecola sp.]|uniref:DUF418 domain-containing protein n=1 Tax=uncultured Paraglaciecola sp. TaxID=1765024 RepID=UPI0026214661|nr:DUF418 domain-containing protein [uncultured Paraglaciecola sp.]